MLFDRFVFILYLLLGYTWFLLGTVFETDYRFVSVISMMMTLLCIVVISLMQLQILLQRNMLQSHDKWSTIAWSTQHILLCVIFCIDGLEWTNIVVIMGLCGLLMSVTIAIVVLCACFVIMQNGQDWHAHIHFTCITFWIMVQYMSLRLPSDDLVVITSVPIVLMTCVRIFEKTSCAQMLLWVVAILLHILRDAGTLDKVTFLYMLALTICGIGFVYRRIILTLMVIPLAIVPATLYVLCRLCCGRQISQSLVDIVQLYNELTAKDLEPIVLPFEDEYENEDWVETL